MKRHSAYTLGSIQQLFDIADNDIVMPPKARGLNQKLRDGLLTML
jgi:hypothetical protein